MVYVMHFFVVRIILHHSRVQTQYLLLNEALKEIIMITSIITILFCSTYFPSIVLKMFAFQCVILCYCAARKITVVDWQKHMVSST